MKRYEKILFVVAVILVGIIGSFLVSIMDDKMTETVLLGTGLLCVVFLAGCVMALINRR